jgi:hypothetical protein
VVKRLSSIAEVLASIPEREDPFPHLAFLSTDDLLLRRREIQQSLNRLEEERQAIDSELVETFSDAELRFGVQFGGGLLLSQRQRTSWVYDDQTRSAIKAISRRHKGQGVPGSRPAPF